jgi:hypothetical protein
MALTKCKECGKEVSTQAKACPNCGAKPPGGTSAFTWGVLFVLVAVAVTYLGSSSDTTPAGKVKTKPVRSAEFQTMRSCLEGIKNSSGQTLDVIADKPTKVSGFLSNGEGFACELKSTGTRGTYYHGWYFASDTQIQAERKEKLTNEEYARKAKLANEAFARKQKLADEKEAERLASPLPENWSNVKASAKCASILHGLYPDAFEVRIFMGKQPTENDTTLVGLTLIDERPEYKGMKVRFGCVFRQDGALDIVFFDSQPAGWKEPVKR